MCGDLFVLGFVSPRVNDVYVLVVFRFLIGFAFPGYLIPATVLTEFVGGSIRPIAIGVLIIKVRIYNNIDI